MADPALGEIVGPVEVGPVAHGGHCVARHDGRVIFVRHALPGERVRVRVTDASHDRFWRGDAVEILSASPDRVPAPCPVARPGGCGGCDFQHVSPAAQRDLKGAVVAEQLLRLAGLERDVVVEPPRPEPVEGPLHWRRRMRYAVTAAGEPALRVHRSNATVPVPDCGCLIAVDDLAHPPTAEGDELVGVAGDDATLWLDGDDVHGSDDEVAVTYHAAGRAWRVSGDGFWQTHPAAADTLAAAVLDLLQPRPDEQVLDLYGGAGLFAGALADQGCRVWGVEGSRSAVDDARHNLRDVADRVRLHVGRVHRELTRTGRTGLPSPVDLVVLDPPRTGAGKDVVRLVAERHPRAIAYVACDPAALARDLATAARHGYALADLRAFDLFPMTHHVECVALLLRSAADSGSTSRGSPRSAAGGGGGGRSG